MRVRLKYKDDLKGLRTWYLWNGEIKRMIAYVGRQV